MAGRGERTADNGYVPQRPCDRTNRRDLSCNWCAPRRPVLRGACDSARGRMRCQCARAGVHRRALAVEQAARRVTASAGSGLRCGSPLSPRLRLTSASSAHNLARAPTLARARHLQSYRLLRKRGLRAQPRPRAIPADALSRVCVTCSWAAVGVTRAGRGVGLRPERECACRCPLLRGACSGARAACAALGQGYEGGQPQAAGLAHSHGRGPRPADSLLGVWERVLRERGIVVQTYPRRQPMFECIAVHARRAVRCP